MRGPQQTLYVPAPVLKPYPAFNVILMFELDHAPCLVVKRSNEILQSGAVTQCSVILQDQAQVDGPYKPFD